MAEENFKCPFCRKETTPLNEELLCSNTRFLNLTEKQLVYCKKHKFLLFERKNVGGGFFKCGFPTWFFLKKLNGEDFKCRDCIYWNLKKGKETEEGIDKTCEFGLQNGRKYAGISCCNGCEQFKFKGKLKWKKNLT